MTQQNTIDEFFGSTVYSYTRAMALADGVLVDISETAKEAGIKYPVAVSEAVWKKYIEWHQDDSAKQVYQDQSGRLWDVCWMARCGIISAGKGNACETLFELYCVPRDGASKDSQLTTLKIHIGGGDDGEPVITIMLPNED